MADQADFPDIYIDSSVEAGGVGSEADPYSAFSEINWGATGDNSITDYYAGGASASVTINLKRGQEWRELFLTGHAGTADYPIIVRAYGVGDNPMINGSVDVTTASFKWTASQGGTNEYFLEAAAGGNPSLASVPIQIFRDDVRCLLAWVVAGTQTELGSMGDLEWEWGHNAADEAAPNSKAVFETIYIRDDSGDPDTSGVVIEASSLEYPVLVSHDYITFDGVDIEKSNNQGARVYGHHVTFQNLSSLYNLRAGIRIYTGADDCTLDTCEFGESWGDAITLGGSYGNIVYRLHITGCAIHDAEYVEGVSYLSAAGIKAFALEDSVIEKSTWYACQFGAIRLDGGAQPESWGCRYNVIRENNIYGCGDISRPQLDVEFSGYNIFAFNWLHDPYEGSDNLKFSRSGCVNNVALCNISEGATSVQANGAGFRNWLLAGDNFYIGNLAYNCRLGFDFKTGSGSYLRNNIAFGCATYAMRVEDEFYSLDSDYNCFYNAGSNPIFENAIGSGSYSVAEWFALTGTEENSIQSDPLCTDPESGDFTLQSESPCIGTGAVLDPEYQEGILSGSIPDSLVTGDRNDF